MEFHVNGMTCAHCVRAITHAIAAIGGTAAVDLERKTVTVEGVTDEAEARRVIEGEGYEVA